MKKAVFISAAIGAVITMMSLESCKKDDNVTAVKPTLYDSLGGTTMVKDPNNSSVMIEQGRLGIR